MFPLTPLPDSSTSICRWLQRCVFAALVCLAPLALLPSAVAQSAPIFSGAITSYQSSYQGQSVSWVAYLSSGSPTPTFQWQRLPSGGSTWANLNEGATYTGTTTNYLNIVSVLVAMNGDQFRCVATNSAGTATSSTGTLFVSAAVTPVIFDVPGSVVLNYGDTLNLSPGVSGSQPLTFQWKKGGVEIAGATSASYYKYSATTGDSGTFTLSATNPAGTTVSSNMTVTVNAAVAPSILNLPASGTYDYGQTISLTPVVTGSPTMTYQWKKDGVNIVGANSAGYYKGSVTTADSGAYTLTVTNSVSTVTSSADAIVVNAAVAPIISGMPASGIYSYGSSVTIYPNVYGSQPMTYQWKKDGVAISGATSYYYSDNALTTDDTGQYTLTVTNPAGTTTSSAATITVSSAVAPTVSIYANSSVTPNYGDWLYLYSNISGTPPITYQWKKDGLAVAGATNYYYYPNSVTTADSGTYTLTVTNVAGTVTSNGVTVSVQPAVAPVISGLPVTLSVPYGNVLTFYPSFGGSSPMTYQWEKDGVAIVGATNSSYVKAGVATADGGVYGLTATNVAGSASASVTVTVNPAIAPTITPTSASVTYNYGDSISLSPVIGGSPPMTYQWKKDGVSIAGATSSSYYKYSSTSADSGSYTLTATNLVDTVTSSAMTVTVNAAIAPAIGSLPSTVTVDYGGTLNLNPTITGTSGMTYQWKKGGIAISGASYSSYSKYSVTTADSGTYTLTVTNVAGTTTSSAVTVSVNAAVAPAIGSLPSTVTLDYGGTLSLNPSITGTPGMTYQWKKDDVAILGANSPSYYKSGITTADSGVYTLVATNVAGSATSSTATVTVNAAVAPVINFLSASITLAYGDTLNLTPVIIGSPATAYQWKKGGVDILGATNNSYNKSGMTVADGGAYTLAVTNSAGTTVSSAVTVTVNAAVLPTIYNLPAGIAVAYGNTISLNPSIGGTQPMTYQWKKGGVTISGATTSYFNKSGASTADSGQYAITVTNAAGAVTSSSVTVAVSAAQAPVISNPVAVVQLDYGYYLGLSPTIGGTQPMTYQWKKDGADIPGATSSNFYLNYVTTADSGAYTLAATNLVGTVTGPAVAVTVRAATPPVITQQPFSVTVLAGTGANFAVTSTGTSPIAYQWYFNGDLIPAGTNSTLYLSAAQNSDAGSYTVVLGNPGGSVTSNVATLTISPPQGVVAASAGNAHSIMIKSDGTLWTWGNNYYGQLGDGTIGGYASATPKQIATGVVAASAGNLHSFFVKSDGTLWGTGYNGNGQLGDGTTSNRLSPVQIATDVVSASAGSSHSLFVKSDGTLWAMGDNSYGQLGDGTYTSHSSPVQIATAVVAAYTGGAHSLFIKSDGTLWAMGQAYFGQLGDGAPYSNRATPVQIATGVITASAGSGHSLFIKSDGTLWGMGQAYNGQLGDGAPSSSRSTPVQIATGVVTASAGNSHSLFIKSDGTLWATGNNGYGQLGDGSTTNRSSPVQVTTEAVAITAGGGHSMLIKSDGELWCMGSNNNGQLGNATSLYGYVTTPVQQTTGPVSTPVVATGVSAGDGLLTGGIKLNWSPSLGASNYEIWRGSTNDSSAATKIASNISSPLYYDLTAVSGTTYYYWIKAGNTAGSSSFSSSDSGVVGIAPTITTQPASQSVLVGNSVTFTAAASGTPLPTLQWKKDGVNVAGATSATYTIASPSAGDAGNYTLVATNPVGAATSSSATLTVIIPPGDAVITFTIE